MVKNPLANAGDAGDAGSILGSGRSPGGGHGNPPQYSCLKNPMDRGAWRATIHWVAKNWTRLKLLSMNAKNFQHTLRPSNIKMKKSRFLPSRNLDSSQILRDYNGNDHLGTSDFLLFVNNASSTLICVENNTSDF